MKKLIGLAAAAVLVASAGSAQAGSGQGGSGQSHAGSAKCPRASANIPIQGTVASVDLPKGELKVTNQGDSRTVHGLPNQLASYSRGDSVSFNVQCINNQPWLPQGFQPSTGVGGTGAAAGQADLGPAKSLSGDVMNLDSNSGTFQLKGLSFRAHPESLQSISQGDRVSVRFYSIDGSNWAESVSSAGQGMGGSGSDFDQGVGGSSSDDLSSPSDNPSDHDVGGTGSDSPPSY